MNLIYLKRAKIKIPYRMLTKDIFMWYNKKRGENVGFH